ncbi:MAG: 16S rRNA (cytosine(1402)-N(4))-methyltransferase RsmH [Candidatus Rifleibacteriota bacterium]
MTTTNSPEHKPVLTEAVLKYAFPENGKIFVDATFGLGGHTKLLLEKFPTLEKVIAIDQDEEILNFSRDRITDKRIIRVHAKASELAGVMALFEINKVDGILLDLGVSSYQLDNAERGFSFTREGPLDMRMNKETSLTAKEVVNKFSPKRLKEIFKQYGEEKFSGRIAQNIEKYRSSGEIDNTSQLAEIVKISIPARVRAKSPIHPATRVFQALRIFINNELDELSSFLDIALACLNPGGHLCIISFHSLEDRIVKKFFKLKSKGCTCPPEFPVCNCGKKPQVKILTRKAIFADDEEKASNPRSRSARLRAIEKLKTGDAA